MFSFFVTNADFWILKLNLLLMRNNQKILDYTFLAGLNFDDSWIFLSNQKS